MKKCIDDINLLKNFKPSNFSGEGFLGKDKRTPEEIIISDLNKLSELGISRYILAERMHDVYTEAVNGFGAEVQIPGLN